jgi:hypothetical protein
MNHYKFFKFSLLVMSLLVGSKSHAENWGKILSCEGGAAYIDVNKDERRHLQLVVKGTDMLGKLSLFGAVSPKFGATEAVLRGDHAYLKQVSPTATQALLLNGIFYNHDFKQMYIDRGGNSVLLLVLQGSELVIKKLSYSNGYSCSNYDETDGICRDPEGAVYHQTYYFEGEYVLRNCEIL